MSQAGIVDFIGTHPEIPTMFVANVGTAVPIANTIELLGASVAAHGVPLQTVASGNTVDFNIQFASAAASSVAGNAGVASFNSGDFNVDANGFVTLAGGGTPAILTLSDDNNPSPPTVPVTPTGGNIQFVGHVVEQGATKFSTVVASPATAPTHILDINPMSSARWIVDPLGFNGTHTTIASAITSATSGDTIMIMPGTYTENLTLKAGVNLAALPSDGYNFIASTTGTPNVTIIGKVTLSTAGTVVLGSIGLQTNSDFALEVSGSATSSVILNNCQINATNNTGISFTSSSSSSLIYLTKCSGNIGTTGIAMWTSTSAGTISINFTTLSNSGGSTTASTTSTGQVSIEHSIILFPISTSSTGFIGSTYSNFNTSAQNVTCITTAGTANNICDYCEFTSGTASSINIGAGTTVSAKYIVASSSNTNVLTGGGTLIYSFITFGGSSSGHNVTTETALATLI